MRRRGIIFSFLVALSTTALPASAAAAPARPSRARQIAVLDAAFAHMRSDYQRLNRSWEPGPSDVLGYSLNGLWSRGIDGAGTTVALLEGWTDPGLSAEIAKFDRALALPPADISTIFPSGPLPRTCPVGMLKLGGYGSCRAWGRELALDVASVHLIAPYAHILLAVTPPTESADAAENVAPPEMMKAVEDISRRHLADVISVSDATGESTYSAGVAEIQAQDPGELTAAAAGVPFVGGTGDCGVVQAEATNQGRGCAHLTSFASVAAWADSPWVTAIGGSVPDLSPNTGSRLGPDHLWSVRAGRLQFSANAGLSTVFTRPGYQDGVAAITHSSMRSVPDITMDASDGVSEATPLFAGVLALATQVNGGRDLGPINPALYALGPKGAAAGIEDVTGGNDSILAPGTGRVIVRGYTASRGFDIASGWGTVMAPRFVHSLVTMTRLLHDEAAERTSAQTALGQIDAAALHATWTPTSAGSPYTGRLTVTGSGLLPNYSVIVSAGGGNQAARVNADGDLDTTIDFAEVQPATVTLHSMLITETVRVADTPGAAN